MENQLDWEGTNLQIYSTEKPEENERELILNLYCIKCKTNKPFTVTASLGDLFVRKTKFIEFGSTCMVCGNKTRVKIGWNKEPSWKFFKKGEGNGR